MVFHFSKGQYILYSMSKENFNIESNPELTLVKTPLEEKMEQLALIRKKKGVLELKKKQPTTPTEGDKINAEYEQVSALVAEIEADVEKLKLEEKNRLDQKFKTL